ncbi:Amino-acid permease BAT1 homolog [Linum perenne]
MSFREGHVLGGSKRVAAMELELEPEPGNNGGSFKAMDSGEKRLNELGYKQELRREMTFVKILGITFSSMAVFVGTPLYGSSLRYAGPASLILGWPVVVFFTWFVGVAMSEICSSFPTTGSLYFWAAHLAGPRWGPFASWCCAWLETIGLVSGIGAQVIGAMVVIIMLPLVAQTTQSASFVFTHFETAPEATGISSKPYAIIMSVLLSNYCLYGYDSAAHLTEETKNADRTGPFAILSSIGLISVFGWAYNLALTFSIQDFNYLYDPNNETGGISVPAQIIYDAFHGRYHSSVGAVVFLCIIWGSFFFCGLAVTASAARVVYALSRDNGIPFSSTWRTLHPKTKVPANAVWLCAAISIILGLPILKLDVVFTAILSISTVGWVGGYAVPIFCRLVMDEKNFKPGPFYLGKARRPVCLVAFLWIGYTCSAFLLPTTYPIQYKNFNYSPIALAVCLGLVMLWWVLDARKWFKGPVRNIEVVNDSSGQHC